MQDFRQVYVHKTSKEKIRVKRVTANDFIVLDKEGKTERVPLSFLKDYSYSKKESKPKRWENLMLFRNNAHV